MIRVKKSKIMKLEYHEACNFMKVTLLQIRFSGSDSVAKLIHLLAMQRSTLAGRPARPFFITWTARGLIRPPADSPFTPLHHRIQHVLANRTILYFATVFGELRDKKLLSILKF